MRGSQEFLLWIFPSRTNHLFGKSNRLGTHTCYNTPPAIISEQKPNKCFAKTCLRAVGIRQEKKWRRGDCEPTTFALAAVALVLRRRFVLDVEEGKLLPRSAHVAIGERIRLQKVHTGRWSG
jgi:hypothetical protein